MLGDWKGQESQIRVTIKIASVLNLVLFSVLLAAFVCLEGISSHNQLLFLAAVLLQVSSSCFYLLEPLRGELNLTAQIVLKSCIILLLTVLWIEAFFFADVLIWKGYLWFGLSVVDVFVLLLVFTTWSNFTLHKTLGAEDKPPTYYDALNLPMNPEIP